MKLTYTLKLSDYIEYNYLMSQFNSAVRKKYNSILRSLLVIVFILVFLLVPNKVNGLLISIIISIIVSFIFPHIYRSIAYKRIKGILEIKKPVFDEISLELRENSICINSKDKVIDIDYKELTNMVYNNKVYIIFYGESDSVIIPIDSLPIDIKSFDKYIKEQLEDE